MGLPNGRLAGGSTGDRKRSIVYAAMQNHPRMIVRDVRNQAPQPHPAKRVRIPSPSDQRARAVCASTVDVMITSIAHMTLNVGHQISDEVARSITRGTVKYPGAPQCVSFATIASFTRDVQ